LNEAHDLAGSDPQDTRRMAAGLNHWSAGMITPKWPTKDRILTAKRAVAPGTTARRQLVTS
jgi:hypothetical protein